ncbi:hypothetical protein CSA37_06645 [Candidatus Fermentibacteria bacterium]|nr:MAG: hypothetical protein CSA37_06645 [Candidatus Fermentibacteria bacterium]
MTGNAVLIPGLGGTADCWSHIFLEILSSSFTIKSLPLPESGTTIGEYASELEPSTRPDLLLGFSAGAAAVQEILAENPLAAKKAVLLAPPAGYDYPPSPPDTHDFTEGRGRWSVKMLEMMFTPKWLADHPDVSSYFPRVKNPVSGETLIRQSNAIEDWAGCLDRLKNVSIPVLIIAGEHDMITPPVHAEAIHKSLCNSQLEMMNTGHGFPWQCPAETAKKILEFVN